MFRLVDKSRASKGIVRFGLPSGGWYNYWTDIFHTLLNMPRYRFLLVFFAIYLTEYLFFALLYLTQPNQCVGGVMKFSHAMWFSVYTAATLGYTGSLSPNPDCASVNVLVIFQVITAALIDYCMMGLVFARFASPSKRSETIRFSSSAVLFQRPEDGLWCLSFRLANIRKTSLINPQVALMLALPLEGHGSVGGAAGSAGAGGGGAAGAAERGVAHFRFQELGIEDSASQVANLRLGLHAHINHIIRPGSPLFDRSLDALEGSGAEVICFMEGVDPMTSNNIQARHSYAAADIRMNERFVPIELRLRRGQLGLDFSGFDATTAKALAAGGADELQDGGFATFLVPVPGPSPGPAPGSSAAGGAGGAAVPISASAAAADMEAGGGWGGGVPLGALGGGGGGGAAGAAGGPSAREMDTVMAAALSGDMRTHMQALRSQSIRSLTTPLSALPTLVPSVGGGGAAAGGPGSMTSASAFARGATHPLASSGGSGFGGVGGGRSVSASVAGAGTPHAGSAAPGGLLSPGELRDLCDAVLTDVGCSAAVKRQAAALKEALSALELLPRGPAELAGRQL
ncbi:hypothetical protein HXX76_001575 [Chlamydomonas incerta]|uniref:Uncharacterized protein n=1 Tax=Chlamydomonas incerta TaxID=51695 RepID=A0A836B1V7_CHLIN|nr:hypothetical protein HXX76_001575 [Chlamydomonas incerta]|eukprot:KAG2444834.1 hypothetical protein HXX76_001575 [Chlamydomonas incerta]